MITKKISRRLCSLFVLILVMAACGGSGTDTTGDDVTATTGSTGTTGAAGGEQVDLLVWASRDWYAPPDAYAAFMERYPNINVTMDVQANDDILQQLQRMQDAGQPMPDVVNDDTFLIEAYNAAGLVLPFDEWKDRWEEEEPEEFPNILPIAWEENTIEGAILGVSLTANFDVLYYNVEWFEEAGIDPTTIDSLDGVLEAMRALKETRPDGIPLTVQALPTTGVTTLKTFLSAAGAPYTGAVPDLQSPGGLYTLDWFIQAANEGLLPAEAISWGEGEARGAFLSKAAGLILDGFTVAGDFAEEPGFDYQTVWGVFPVPASQTGAQKDGNQISNARSWFISSGTEHPYEASLAIRYVNETLVDQALNGSVPMRNSAKLADPRLTEFWPFFTDQLREAYAGSASVPAGLNGGEVEAVLEELFGEIVIGTDSTAQELADKYQPMLDAL
jgi:ABC-type glycerol-3-phosphate transport system substrate-binding protein